MRKNALVCVIGIAILLVVGIKVGALPDPLKKLPSFLKFNSNTVKGVSKAPAGQALLSDGNSATIWGNVEGVNVASNLSGSPVAAGGVLTANGAGQASWAPVSIVTSVGTTAGQLTGGPITTTGTLGLATTGTAGTYGSATQVPVMTTDAFGRVTGVTNTTITGTVSGGTTNQLAKFTSATALGSSVIFDNGTTVGLGTTTPTTMAKMEISGVGIYSVAPYYHAGLVVDGPTDASASGTYSSGGWKGVFGHNLGTAGGVQAIGVHGRLEGSSYTTAGYGVLAEAVGTGPTNYGIYAAASGAATNYAGYFSGNVHITGTLSKGGGTFKIDHPLDPENKYLSHSFVESPDMMNIYNGNITTDANGDATVDLPSYFNVLNKDFRYQLTVIGTFAQAIVAQKISGNSFKIKTDKPNVEVSWQVTGVRQDKFANAHRVVPEEDKEARNKGKYLNAAEWGLPQNKSIDFINTSNENRAANNTTK